MNKLPNNTYFLYRILFPGMWFSILLIINLIMHDIEFYKKIITDTQLFIALPVLGVVFGLIIHYLINYPRKRKRFKLIEKENGPIQYIVDRLQAKYPNIISRVPLKKIYSFYFSILNDDIPTSSKERIYYFSSIYYLIYHIGFISILFIIFNIMYLIINSINICPYLYFTLIPFDLYCPSLIETIFLGTFCFIIMKKESKGERCLRLMFNNQKDWVERNWKLVEKRFIDSFGNGIVYDNN